jgi:DnaK suppressor protein
MGDNNLQEKEEGFMDESRGSLYQECKKRLMKVKQEKLNNMMSFDASLSNHINGDEGDMSQAIEDQHTAIAQRERVTRELKEIDQALQRIEDGEYGVCEETEEEIEEKRLLAIPWTRLSLEGAEIRERQRKRFAV